MSHLDQRLGLIFLCPKNLPEVGTPVPKYVGALIVVMNFIEVFKTVDATIAGIYTVLVTPKSSARGTQDVCREMVNHEVDRGFFLQLLFGEVLGFQTSK
jgi:uncharacterized protein (DUF2235 family)